MKLNFCPECAAPLTKKTNTEYICANGHPYWNNAKASVALAFVKDGQLLINQRGRKSDPNYGLYDLPGGFVDYGESAYTCAIREAKEETTVQLEPNDLELLAVYHNDYNLGISSVDIVFLVRHWQGEFKADDDSAALIWKPLDFIYDPDFCEKYYTGLDKLIQQKLTA